MSDEIGKIQKPSSKDIIGKRKAFICVLLQAPPEASKELHDLIQKYWVAIDTNITNLEEKTGTVKRIFIEGIPGKGEDVSISLKEASLGAWNILQERLSSGAQFEEFENLEILQKVIDWSKCLNVGLSNRSVAEKISEELKKESESRINYINNSIDKNLKDGESCIIFTGNQEIELPEGVEKFIISPPELDTVAQWVKNAQAAMEAQMKEQFEAQQQATQNIDASDESDQDKSDSGIWTPN
ncbi:MAG: hypothetical protein CL772_01705 [Chloroflexi bacterium]|nr:hypothetical protein [Chloroflexota bacterium]MBK89879.1 hypothetical protein [Chloroflexota bacterium]|tara:strand:+ start:332 stop:1054 length:723 start_codon:yes stop_codon:yes gene_type:complete